MLEVQTALVFSAQVPYNEQRNNILCRIAAKGAIHECHRYRRWGLRPHGRHHRKGGHIPRCWSGNSVTLLERQARVGRKLLSTGNGRCNLTNLNMGLPYYHGQDAAFIRPAFEALSLDATLDFFHGLGLLTTAEDNGRVYPYSDQAGSVVDVLRFAADAAGVTTRAGFEVTGLKKTKQGFTVLSAEETLPAGPAAAMSCCNPWATASPSCIPHWCRSRRTTPLSRL